MSQQSLSKKKIHPMTWASYVIAIISFLFTLVSDSFMMSFDLPFLEYVWIPIYWFFIPLSGSIMGLTFGIIARRKTRNEKEKWSNGRYISLAIGLNVLAMMVAVVRPLVLVLGLLL